jgi:hypothetical protein
MPPGGCAVSDLVKLKEVQFHLDRIRESSLQMIRSIVDNPRLSQLEQIKYLHQIATEHAEIASSIACRFPKDVIYNVPKD